jgi:hypothetical protein
VAAQKFDYRVTFVPAKGKFAGQVITRTFVAENGHEAQESCFRVFPDSVVREVKEPDA